MPPGIASPVSKSTPDRMQCMEIWGGNHRTVKSLSLTGLDLWVFSQPYGEAEGGGDVFYVSSCASGRITRMLLADVSGHGDVVSNVAKQLRDLMRKNVNYIRQSRLAEAMNRQFSELAQGFGFATAIVATYFAPTRTLTVCNAGHPAPFLFRAHSGRWSTIHHADSAAGAIVNVPLGVSQETMFPQRSYKLDPGDMLLAYTDSLTEACHSDGTFLGETGLLELVRSLPMTEPRELVPALIDALRELHPTNLLMDDVTVLLARCNGSGPRFRDNLLALLRLIRGVTDQSLVLVPQHTARARSES